MFCVLALIVFSLLGIFSASHRQLAKEALDCVFRRVTFRPCHADFREKIKGKILARLLNRSVIVAKIFNKYFELLSWLFFILMVISTIWVVRGGINFYLYGNCNGINQEGFCLFDPTGENNKVSTVNNACLTEPPSAANLKLENLDISQFPYINNNSQNEVVFIGCYSCDYSRESYPIVKKLLDKKKPNFTFIHFPVKDDTRYLSNYDYCAYQADQQKFWRFNDLIFSSAKEDLANIDFVDGLIAQAGYNLEKIKECVNSEATEAIVDSQFQEIKTINIYGTPTIFINHKPVVGPKPYRVYERMLK